jgi:hypothetical protein
MNPTQGTGLLDLAPERHGGIERWSEARTIRARLVMGGPTWAAVGQEKIFADVGVAVDVHEQRTVFAAAPAPRGTGYTPPWPPASTSGGCG